MRTAMSMVLGLALVFALALTASAEEKKADNIVAAFQYADSHWTPWIGVMSVWTFADPTWDGNREEYWWAMTNPDGSTRPAYTRIRDARASALLR